MKFKHSITFYDGEIRYYAEDTTQPFYVPFDKRHLFRGIKASGYLPPLELPEDHSLGERLTSLEEKPPVTHIYMGAKSLSINRRLAELENSIQEHYQYHSKRKKETRAHQFTSVKEEKD